MIRRGAHMNCRAKQLGRRALGILGSEPPSNMADPHFIPGKNLRQRKSDAARASSTGPVGPTYRIDWDFYLGFRVLFTIFI